MSKARKAETGIRITHATLARLREMRDRIVDQVQEGKRADVDVASETINPASNGLSLDTVINLLLDARDAHHQRARQQAEKRRKGTAQK